MNNFGEHLKSIRLNKGLTINQLSLYSGISSSQLSRIETGKRGIPKPSTIEKLANALKVDYNELMKIAEYLETQVVVDSIGNEEKSTFSSQLTEKDERDIAKRVDELREDLSSATGLLFNGEPMSEEAKESLLEAMEFGIRLAKKSNKKFIPKNYRDKEE